jgi:hypothetical protein
MSSRDRSADPVDARVMDGEIWDAFCSALKSSGQLVLDPEVPASPGDRAEGFRYLTRLLAAGTLICVEHADPDYPTFGRMVDLTMSWGLDCPDCLYLYASVRGDASYRIWGQRGTANHLDVQVNHGHFASGDISAWGTISSANGLDLEVASDGSFELNLSADERPGNWLRLEPNAEFVLVRQYFNDWQNERPADLLIERIGAEHPPPALRTDQIAARLDRLGMWLERSGALWEKMSKGYLSMPPNTLVVHVTKESDKHAGMRGQAYGMGNFRCAPDEAVIDWYWESLDFARRQSSLNGHQAALDGDGVFRGVISHADPGVPNWLDPAGHRQGSIAARFLLAASPPEPTLRTLKLADLRAALPEHTPRIEPAARAAQLEARRHAAWRRYRR